MLAEAPTRTDLGGPPSSDRMAAAGPTPSRSATTPINCTSRTPDWAKVEELLGIELNKALQAGSGGGAALDAAAQQVTDYLKQAGYYQ